MSATASSSLSSLLTRTSIETKRFFCPFLKRGFCRNSSRCNFSHDNVGSIKIPPDYCHFYLANQCLYGSDCKFRHSEPIPDEDLSSSQIGHTAIPTNTTTTTITTSNNNTDINNLSICGSNSDHNYSHHSQQFQQSSSSTPASSTHKPNLNKLEISNYDSGETHLSDEYSLQNTTSQLFPTAQCSYLNGLECDLCGRQCLHPYDLEQQRQHREDCLREHEREMELSFAVQRSKDKVCGICMDTVVEKKPITSSRFGILEKCNHIFCLDCIRKWRGTKQFETRTIRACPECRVSSDFVVPSKYWIEDQDDKEKLIRNYKAALRSKPCKYFDEGKGDCPFAGSCFYKHAYPDGRIAKLGTPKPRRRFDSEAVANLILWNILTSTDDDDWSNEDIESLYPDLDFGTEDEDEDEDDEDEDEGEDEDDEDENEDEEDDDDLALDQVHDEDDEEDDQEGEDEEEGFDRVFDPARDFASGL